MRWKKKIGVNLGFSFLAFQECVCNHVGMCIFMSVCDFSFSGVCCLGTMV